MMRRFLPTPGETSTRPKARASSVFTARLIASLRPMTMSVSTCGWRAVIVSASAFVAFGALTTAHTSGRHGSVLGSPSFVSGPDAASIGVVRSATASARGASAATIRASSRRSL